MKKKCIVERRIDYHKEAIELTFRIINGRTYRELKEEILKRSKKTEQEFLIKIFDSLSEIEDDMKKKIAIHDRKLQYYFKQFGREELCIAKILYQGMSYIKIPNDIEGKKKVLVDWIERMVEDNSLELTLNKSELTADKYEDGKQETFIERIGHLECDEAKKWELLYLLVHAKKCVDELFQILEPIINELRKFETIIQKLVDECADYWDACFRKESFLTLLSNFFGVTENSYPDVKAYIRPQVMECDRVIFIGNDETMKDYHILEVGITFDKEFKATKRRPTDEQICNGLKLLSDPSKFEILKNINGRKAYGQELASMTNLTTATISHHMNALMTFGFITLEKMDNKVFYTMNREAVKEFLATASLVLVEEENNEV